MMKYDSWRSVLNAPMCGGKTTFLLVVRLVGRAVCS